MTGHAARDYTSAMGEETNQLYTEIFLPPTGERKMLFTRNNLLNVLGKKRGEWSKNTLHALRAIANA